jgi:hypothetical protein
MKIINLDVYLWTGLIDSTGERLNKIQRTFEKILEFWSS